MSNDVRRCLIRQFETAWKLAVYHLDGLTTEECLWQPARKGLHVYQQADGRWRADWPKSEGYDIGPPSIAWTTWHLGFWWSMALDHSFGAAALTREQVAWPGDAASVRQWITGLQLEWRTALEQMTDVGLLSSERTRWPHQAQDGAANKEERNLWQGPPHGAQGNGYHVQMQQRQGVESNSDECVP